MPYQVRKDEILLPVRRNDNLSSKIYDGTHYTGWRDGMCSGAIVGKDYAPVLSDHALSVCSWFRVTSEFWAEVKKWQTSQTADIDLQSSDGKIIPTGVAIDWDVLDKLAMKDVAGKSLSLLSDVRDQKYSLPVNALSLGKSMLVDATKKTFASESDLKDRLAITAGNYDVGISGDYPTFGGAGGAMADTGGLTNNLTLTLISSTTETAVAQLTNFLNGYDLSILSDTAHNGDPTVGNVISFSSVHFFDFRQEGAGRTIIDGASIKRSAAAGGTGWSLVLTYQIGTAFDLIIKNSMFDGVSYGGSGIKQLDNSTILKISNCCLWNHDFGIVTQDGSSDDYIENVSITDCAAGFDANSKSVKLINIASIGNTTDYANITNATLQKCFDADGTGTDTTTAGAAWVSTDDTNSSFLDIKSGGSLDGAGVTNTLTRSTGIRGRTVPGPNGTSVGAAEVLASGLAGALVNRKSRLGTLVGGGLV